MQKWDRMGPRGWRGVKNLGPERSLLLQHHLHDHGNINTGPAARGVSIEIQGKGGAWATLFLSHSMGGTSWPCHSGMVCLSSGGRPGALSQTT